jgi:hypothetical protein
VIVAVATTVPKTVLKFNNAGLSYYFGKQQCKPREQVLRRLFAGSAFGNRDEDQLWAANPLIILIADKECCDFMK